MLFVKLNYIEMNSFLSFVNNSAKWSTINPRLSQGYLKVISLSLQLQCKYVVGQKMDNSKKYRTRKKLQTSTMILNNGKM